MTTGTTPFLYPDRQPPNQTTIQPGNHYYQFRLHEANAFFNASWFAGLEVLLLVSEVESTIHPDTVIRSLHAVKTAKRNQSCQMGLRLNLTSWLPARSSDSCKITIKYIGIQSSPTKNFVEQLQESGLSVVVSMLEPEWQVALKVSDIVGKMTSYLLREGFAHELFAVTHEFNLDSLKTGYYAAIGHAPNEEVTSNLIWGPQQKLLSKGGRRPVENLSYATLRVAMQTRMGEEVVRHEPWWQILKTAKDEIVDGEFSLSGSSTADKTVELMQLWGDALRQAKKLIREDKRYLSIEVKDIFASFSQEIKEKLDPPRTRQSFGETSIPIAWQPFLDVSTLEELENRAANYKEELQWSQEQQAEVV